MIRSRALTIGRPIIVGDVVSKSARIIISNPIIMLPQLLLLIPTFFSDALNLPILNLLWLLLAIAAVIFSIVVEGAYPSMVKALLEGGRLSIMDALRRAYHRFWSLVLAGIVVTVLVFAGFIAFVVPGLILSTWYAYTVPAIILEDKGAIEGMSASRAFGRDKKWSTFLILLVLGLVGLAAYVVAGLISLGSLVLGQVIDALVNVPLTAWIAVAASYCYITYGPSSVTATPGVQVLGATPPAEPEQPQAQGGPPRMAAPTHYCPSCGSPVEPGARFCRNCGTRL